MQHVPTSQLKKLKGEIKIGKIVYNHFFEKENEVLSA